MKAIFALLTAAAGAAVTVLAYAAQPPRPVTVPAGPATPPPIVSDVRWHHVGMNVTDPKASVAFYTTHFDAKPAKWNGQDAVWTQKSWMLFTKVKQPPSKMLNSAIWHIGWGTEDPKKEYVRQQGLGATFFVPLTDISINNGGTRDRFYFMYLQDPDRGLIEVNTANHHRFGHMHLFSADPIAAGDWYIKTFGFRGRLSGPETNRAPRFGVNGNQLSPSSSLNLDNLNLIIYPVGYSKNAYKEAWQGVTELQSTRGRVHDHMGLEVPDLDAALKSLRAAGVKVTSGVKTQARGKIRTAFIEGPDKIAIQLIEDHTEHPPEE